VLPESQIVVVGVPGTHYSVMKDPHISHLGREISSALADTWIEKDVHHG
jgi:hypothetical protein